MRRFCELTIPENGSAKKFGSPDFCILLGAEEQIDVGERARRYAAEVRKAYRPLEVGQDGRANRRRW